MYICICIYTAVKRDCVRYRRTKALLMYMYVYMYMCMYMCMYMYMYMYT